MNNRCFTVINSCDSYKLTQQITKSGFWVLYTSRKSDDNLACSPPTGRCFNWYHDVTCSRRTGRGLSWCHVIRVKVLAYRTKSGDTGCVDGTFLWQNKDEHLQYCYKDNWVLYVRLHVEFWRNTSAVSYLALIVKCDYLVPKTVTIHNFLLICYSLPCSARAL